MYNIIGLILMLIGILMLLFGLYKYVLWASQANSIDALMRAGMSKEEAKIIVRAFYRANGF